MNRPATLANLIPILALSLLFANPVMGIEPVCPAPDCEGLYRTGEFYENGCPVYDCGREGVDVPQPVDACEKPNCPGTYEVGGENAGCPVYICLSDRNTGGDAGTGEDATGNGEERGYVPPASGDPAPGTSNPGWPANMEVGSAREVQIGTDAGASNVRIAKVSGENIEITEAGVSVTTAGRLLVKEEKLLMDTSEGEQEIKIMPSTASEVAIAQLEMKGYTIELKDAGKPVYEVNGEKEVRILGLIRSTMGVSARIDAQNGEVISTDKPWWGFLAAE